MSLLAVAGVWARYPGQRADAEVLCGIDLQVAAGEIVALIGPNGAGKSTLLRTIGGLLRPHAGGVQLDGRAVAGLGPREIARTVAVVPQEGPIPAGLLVREMVDFGRTPHRHALFGPTRADQTAVDWAMQAAEVAHLQHRLVEELSGGERQRVILARALAQQPRLLLLDEPTANLDLHHQVAMLELVRGLSRDRGLGVLAAVHDLQLAALYCDRVALMRAGRIVSTGPPEVVLTEALLLETFEQRVALAAHPTQGVPLVALVPNGNARRVGSARE